MAKSDIIFKNMCHDILTNGTDTRGELMRGVWKDTNETAYTIKKFGHVAEYDLSEEFPALTIRPIGIKSAINEVLWIYQKKSDNIKDLRPHIWDSWADENGSIGKAYGYQVVKRFIYETIKKPLGEATAMMAEKLKDGPTYPSMMLRPNEKNTLYTDVYMDQMDAVLYALRFTPFNRRIIITIFNPEDLHAMNLQPCCWSLTFSVTNEGKDKYVLNMILNQRSNDVLAANNWNVVQYSALLMMVARSVNMYPGKMLHVIADCHIYDRHVDTIKELLTRPVYNAPLVTLNPDKTWFYDFTEDDFKIENYEYGDRVTNIPISV